MTDVQTEPAPKPPVRSISIARQNNAIIIRDGEMITEALIIPGSFILRPMQDKIQICSEGTYLLIETARVALVGTAQFDGDTNQLLIALLAGTFFSNTTVSP